MNKFRMKRAGINVNQGLQRLFGDQEMYEGLLVKFLDDPNYAAMKQALAEGNVEQAFSAAHSLKGVSGNLSMTDLYDAVVPVVEILRGGSLDVQEGMPAVDAAYEAAAAAIREMMQ